MRQLILFLSLLVSAIAHGQTTTSLLPCWVHLDKPFYVTEDVVGFQLFLPVEFKEETVMLQSILFDPNGRAVAYAYHPTKGKTTVSGILDLPASLSTNWYYISFRVWDEISKTERVLAQVPLAVYNDQAAVTDTQVSQREPSAVARKVIIPEKELQINISSKPASPQPGEEVRLSVQVTDRRGRPVQAQFSLSVSDWSILSPSLAMAMDNLFSSDSLRVILPSRLTSNFYWQGLLLNESNEPAADQKIIIQTDDKTRMQTLYSNKRGRVFYHAEPVSYGLNNWTYENGQAARLLFYPQTGRLVMSELFYTPAVFASLDISRQRKQIYQLSGSKQYQDVQPAYHSLIEINGRLNIYNPGDSAEEGWLPRADTAHLPPRPSLLWQASQQTNEDGEWEISFTQGQDVSAYRIDVVAQDKDGKRGRGSVIYQVKKLTK